MLSPGKNSYRFSALSKKSNTILGVVQLEYKQGCSASGLRQKLKIIFWCVFRVPGTHVEVLCNVSVPCTLQVRLDMVLLVPMLQFRREG